MLKLPPAPARTYYVACILPPPLRQNALYTPIEGIKELIAVAPKIAQVTLYARFLLLSLPSLPYFTAEGTFELIAQAL